jgi:hypothetical protein
VRSLCLTAALACVLGSSKPAHASPGAVDLSLRPSELARVEGTGTVDLSPRAPEPSTSAGQYVGPMWIDGVYTKPLRKLPRQMRQGMAQPVGPSVTVVQNFHLGTGAGPGLYARF